MNLSSGAPGYMSQLTPTLNRTKPHMFEKKKTIEIKQPDKPTAEELAEKRRKLLEDMVREAREAGLYIEKAQRFKNCPRIYITIISFFETERATLTQILSKEFYETITP